MIRATSIHRRRSERLGLPPYDPEITRERAGELMGHEHLDILQQPAQAGAGELHRHMSRRPARWPADGLLAKEKKISFREGLPTTTP